MATISIWWATMPKNRAPKKSRKSGLPNTAVSYHPSVILPKHKQKGSSMHFGSLLPELIFQTVTVEGWRPTGVLYPLNSYENRVYEIHLEEAPPIIAKYYRPGRWSINAISDEHRFLKTLAEAEIPVVSPLELKAPVPQVPTLGKT